MDDSRLRHPNVVSMLGYCKKDGFLCLITGMHFEVLLWSMLIILIPSILVYQYKEFVGGGNLADTIKGKLIRYNPLDLAISLCS